MRTPMLFYISRRYDRKKEIMKRFKSSTTSPSGGLESAASPASSSAASAAALDMAAAANYANNDYYYAKAATAAAAATTDPLRDYYAGTHAYYQVLPHNFICVVMLEYCFIMSYVSWLAACRLFY